MDPRVLQSLTGQMPGMGAPPHPAMLPGVLQVETFSEPLEELERFDARVNAFLAELPSKAAVIDRQLVVAEGRATLMLVLKIPTS